MHHAPRIKSFQIAGNERHQAGKATERPLTCERPLPGDDVVVVLGPCPRKWVPQDPEGLHTGQGRLDVCKGLGDHVVVDPGVHHYPVVVNNRPILDACLQGGGGGSSKCP